MNLSEDYALRSDFCGVDSKSEPSSLPQCLFVHSFCLFFALLKILEMNEIGVYECVIVYSDVLKVCYVFWMLQFVDVNLCAKQEKL